MAIYVWFFGEENYQTENSPYTTFFLGCWEELSFEQHGIYTPKPLYGVGFKATQQGLGRGPCEGIGLGWCLERDISTEGVNLGAALCMGTLV